VRRAYIESNLIVFLYMLWFSSKTWLCSSENSEADIQTSDYMLCYQASELLLVGYSDADWDGNPDERKSTKGYTFLLNGGAIT